MPDGCADNTTRTFYATDLEEVVAQVLEHIIGRPGRGGDDTFTLLFSGDAATPEGAIRAALDDIAGQCEDHRAVPVEVTTGAVRPTDAGTRIWGTLECLPASREALATLSWPEISLDKESDEQWIVTTAQN